MNLLQCENKNANQCFFADINYKEEINQLRMQEYAKASGFIVDLSTLKWKSSDDESYIMVAKNETQIVSTMRGEIINNLSLLEKKLECPWNYPIQINMPVLLLSRAATDSSYRSSGLNLVLRYWFLRLALHHNVRYVVGTFVAGSPRENSLREMGYQFFENPLGWQQSTYRSVREVKIVVLDMKTHGEQALHYCLNRVSKTINEFSFDEDFPELKYVRSI